MTRIHATAIVDPSAELDDSVEVGPYSIIGPHVKVGARTRIGPHVVVEGHTTIGCDNRFFQFCSIGAIPQDMKYKNEPTRLEVGDRNTVREFCTFNLGTAQDAGVTRLGNDNWISAYVHLAHDCQVGSNTVFSNNATLAGHVHVGDWAILSGFVGIHQFCRIGAHAFVGFYSAVSQDVPPFVLLAGSPAAPHGINAEGLKRRGFSPEQISDLRKAYRSLYRSNLSMDESKAAIAQLELESPGTAVHLKSLREFLETSTRGIVR